MMLQDFPDELTKIAAVYKFNRISLNLWDHSGESQLPCSRQPWRQLTCMACQQLWRVSREADLPKTSLELTAATGHNLIAAS